MTYEDFLKLDGPLPIMMDDGRMGLCNHWTKTEVMVDIYEDNNNSSVETKRIRFEDIIHLRGGALCHKDCL